MRVEREVSLARGSSACCATTLTCALTVTRPARRARGDTAPHIPPNASSLEWMLVRDHSLPTCWLGLSQGEFLWQLMPHMSISNAYMHDFSVCAGCTHACALFNCGVCLCTTHSSRHTQAYYYDAPDLKAVSPVPVLTGLTTRVSDSSSLDLYYGGESHSVETPLSYTCPLCAQLGFSEAQLRDHVTKQHGESGGSQEVICPVCASHPSGDPNHLTDDFLSHLTMEHRPPRDYELVISSHSPPLLSLLEFWQHENVT